VILPILEPDMIKTALARSLLNLSAVVDDNVVGMLRVVGDGIFVFILCDVMVMPEYRNLGIASALVTYSLQCVEHMLPSGVVGVVSLFSVKEHVKLYKRLGFTALPRGSRGPGMQTIVYGK
jgi:ribosomal protein S18 acetylase RimI-like enzyme